MCGGASTNLMALVTASSAQTKSTLSGESLGSTLVTILFHLWAKEGKVLPRTSARSGSPPMRPGP